MSTKLIRFNDKKMTNPVLFEVEVRGTQVQQISNSLAEKVERTFDETLAHVGPLLAKVCLPIAEAQKSMKDFDLHEAEIELGLGFEAEGNVYITKTTANANIYITMRLKPVRSS